MSSTREDAAWKCSPDGDPASWPDYTRRVRLAFERTKPKKRKYLGPELVAQLSGKAWVARQEISHERLLQPDGARYLRVPGVKVGPHSGSRCRGEGRGTFGTTLSFTGHGYGYLVPTSARIVPGPATGFEAGGLGVLYLQLALLPLPHPFLPWRRRLPPPLGPQQGEGRARKPFPSQKLGTVRWRWPRSIPVCEPLETLEIGLV